MSRTALFLLGTERLVHAGRGMTEVPAIFWSVIGCLLVARRHSMSRARIAAKLWPDKEEEAARHCLASALWRMRARSRPFALPIVVDGDLVALAGGTIWIDALAFERRAQAALEQPSRLVSAHERRRLARALRMYGGDLLSEIDQEDIQIERARLHSLYLDALYELSRAHAAAEEWPEAMRSARTVCALEPLREDAQRLLIEALARCGNRALALRQLEICKQVLARELQVAPMPETMALRHRLLGARPCETHRVETGRDDCGTALLNARARLVEALSVIEHAIGSI